MKHLTTLLIILLTVPAYANFPVKQSQTWHVGEDKIYVSEKNTMLWEIDHTCDKGISKEAEVAIIVDRPNKFFNQNRIRKDTSFQLVVNGEPQMCKVQRVGYLR